MENEKWLRALDAVEPELESKEKFNELFNSFIKEFDVSFDRGVLANLGTYVKRKGSKANISYEEEFSSYLFSTHKNPAGKAYLLKGKVGSGKTTFVRYLKNKVFPKILIAKAKKQGRKLNIEYVDFKKKYDL